MIFLKLQDIDDLWLKKIGLMVKTQSLKKIALFTIGQRWEQDKCSWRDEEMKKNLICTYNGKLFILKKEENLVTCYDMNEM